jgi:hypothetical protein
MKDVSLSSSFFYLNGIRAPVESGVSPDSCARRKARVRALETSRVETFMLFMVVEHFRDNDMVPVYQRLRQAGRSLPEGLAYVDSWVAADFSRCFQLMRCDDLPLIQAWILEWRGAGVTFEIVPVVTSAETRAAVEPHLDRP